MVDKILRFLGNLEIPLRRISDGTYLRFAQWGGSSLSWVRKLFWQTRLILFTVSSVAGGEWLKSDYSLD